MITINLLPTEFRRKIEKPQVISLRFGMILACFVALLLWFGIAFMLGTSHRELDNFSNEWKHLEIGAKEADRIMLDINQNYLERKKTCDLILAMDMSWAYVLNQVSDRLPDTAWLKRIKLSSTGLEDWEFLVKGMIKTSEKEPPIKVIGHYISSIKPSLEQSVKPAPVSRPAVAAVSSGSELDVQTSTNQEILNDIVLNSFEATFNMKEKPRETVRDKSKPA